MKELTADNVHDTFIKCLFKAGEDHSNFVEAEGVMVKIGFHPGRIAEKTEEINQMIEQLPNEFKKDTGGGWTFLNACQNAKGEQWADMHQTIDELVCLGLATKKISYLMPREFWQMFPGGMPYIVVN